MLSTLRLKQKSFHPIFCPFFWINLTRLETYRVKFVAYCECISERILMILYILGFIYKTITYSIHLSVNIFLEAMTVRNKFKVINGQGYNFSICPCCALVLFTDYCSTIILERSLLCTQMRQMCARAPHYVCYQTRVYMKYTFFPLTFAAM